MKNFKTLFAIGALAIVLAALPTVRSALAGHECHDYYTGTPPAAPKAFFDVNQTNAGMMRDYLTVINNTYDSMVSKGVSPSRIDLVLSLRGLTVTFVTNGFGAGTADEQTGQQIRQLLTSLMSKGVRIEACAISLQWMGVAPEDLLSGIVVIDNAFIESMWYQSRGFGAISLFQP